MRLGYTDSATGDGSKAGTLFRWWRKHWIELGMPRKSATQMGCLQHVIAEHKTHLIIECSEVEFALQRETVTA
jgi:hypothetical protein